MLGSRLMASCIKICDQAIGYAPVFLFTALIGVIMMPWKLMNSMGGYIFTWLIGYSGLMGAIAGILICDYWILRRRRLDLAGLFETNGPYSYSRGPSIGLLLYLLAFAALLLPVTVAALGSAAAWRGRRAGRRPSSA